MQRHDRRTEEIVAGALDAFTDGVGAGLAGREIEEAKLGINGGRLPDVGPAL
jgi:hypothetical protein